MCNEIFIKLLSDIAVLKPERLQHYELEFSEILDGRHEGYSFVYDNETSSFELAYSECGIVVGGINENSVDDFRISFLQHEFFPIRFKTAQTDLERFISSVYSLFDNKACIEKRVEKYIKQYKFSNFDYGTMKFTKTSK